MSAVGDRPGFAVLADWVEGRLGAEDSRRVAELVRLGDARVQDTVAWLRGFLAAAEAVPLYRTPPIVRQNLRRAFAQWRMDREIGPQPQVTVPAELAFDSRRDLAVAGIRAGAGLEETVHLAYACEVADIVLDVRRLGRDRVGIDGQVLLIEPGAAPIFAAAVSGPGFSARTVDGDELGRFHLSGIPEQVVELRVSNGETEIVAVVDVAGGS